MPPRAARDSSEGDGTMPDKWDDRFLALAEHVGGWSKDPSTRVGACIVRPDRTVASMGFNGLPRGVQDTEDRLHARDTKLAMTIHAELNAILSSHVPVRGYTIYCTMPCCDRCAAHIIQAGLVRVVARRPTARMLDRWAESFQTADEMLLEAGVRVDWT